MTNQAPKRNNLKWILPLLILILAIGGTIAITKSRKTPSKKERVDRGVLVKTLAVTRQSEHAMVYATGTVTPLRQISLVAEVTGKLTWVSSRFTEGGFFRKGEKILAVESRDYQLAVEAAEAQRAQAEIALQTEQHQAEIARHEWDRLELPSNQQPSPLVLREPQLAGAKANLKAAQAALEQARLNLERTQIRAPFNGRISSKSVDLGGYIRSGNPLAIYADSSIAEIIVPLPVEELQWLNVPPAGSQQKGSPCQISAQLGDQTARWQGAINRSFAEIDSATRMTKIAIRVDAPYRLTKEAEATSLPLSHGLFVNIAMQGRTLPQVISIPRSALHEGNSVWLFNHEQLEIRPIHILRRQQQELIVDQGLEEGDQLILTSISGAATGMRLRVQAKETL